MEVKNLSLKGIASYAMANGLKLKVLSVKGKLVRLAAVNAMGEKLAYASGYRLEGGAA